MDKEQQIEEMGKIICGRCKDGICLIDKSLCHGLCKELEAEALYNAGFRKIDDDCAVITKDELKQYKVQAVREFAEKVKMAFFYEFDEIIPSIMSDKINELLKELE